MASLRRSYRHLKFKSSYPRPICRYFRWPSKTSSLLVSFLFVNLFGRLSVATFGLVFSINDTPGDTPATYASAWDQEWDTAPDLSQYGMFVVICLQVTYSIFM
jgi:hypothetical protein